MSDETSDEFEQPTKDTDPGATQDVGAEPPTEPAALPAEPVFTEADLSERVAAATAEAKDRHLRLVAEYDNFRKRVQREREMWAAEAIERFVGDLLPVLDNFDRALSAKADDPRASVEGVRLTEKQLRGVLSKNGVETIDPVNAKFDPRFHEAVQRVPAGEKAPAGNVVTVFEKGYTLKGRLLRPARVQVAGDA